MTFLDPYPMSSSFQAAIDHSPAAAAAVMTLEATYPTATRALENDENGTWLAENAKTMLTGIGFPGDRVASLVAERTHGVDIYAADFVQVLETLADERG